MQPLVSALLLCGCLSTEHNLANLGQMSYRGQSSYWPLACIISVSLTWVWVFADLASKASEYTEDAVAIAAVLGLAAAALYTVTVLLKKQRNKEIEEAEALLRQEQELASRSPVSRVQRLVQRLKGNA